MPEESLRFLLLAEGDAETADSWSGSSHQIVRELRRQGHRVAVGDVDLRGVPRLALAAATFSPSRHRWRSRFRIGPLGHRMRSGRARVLARRLSGEFDAILQVGATFDIASAVDAPTLLLSDSNIAMARHPDAVAFTEASGVPASLLRASEQAERVVYERVSRILTLSEYTRRSFLRDFGRPADQVATIHAGPNAALQVPLGTTPRRSMRILFVGRQFERKGGDVLLEAFRSVRAELPDAELWIVGPEPREPEPGVRWLGFLSQDSAASRHALAEAFSSSSVYCLPTKFEPLGISIVEAMHLGLPCVATDRWAIPEMIVDGETGFLVPPGDAAVLADRLTRILRDPDLARRFGDAGQQRARAMFTWESAVQRIVSATREVLADRLNR